MLLPIQQLARLMAGIILYTQSRHIVLNGAKLVWSRINYHFRQDGEHRFAYDHETLHHVLAEAGFRDIRRRAFDATLDTENRKIGTLYVDAEK